MKKLFLSLCVLLSCSVNAQKLTPKVAFDYFTNGYKTKVFNNQFRYGDFRTRIGIDFDWKIFKVYTDTHTYMDWNSDNSTARPSFSPVLNQWYIGGQVKVKGIVVKYEHLCIHPVKTHGKKDLEIYGGYDMFSVSYNY